MRALSSALPHLSTSGSRILDFAEIARRAQPDGIRIQQQVDDDKAKQQAKKQNALRTSSKEDERASQGHSCRAALTALEQTFESQRSAIGYPDRSELGLGSFGPWLAKAELTPSQRQAADLVVAAEKRFGDECLSAAIPPEMNPDLVKRAVGIISFEDQVFCTALRINETEILTARHCFVSSQDSSPTMEVRQALNGAGRMWFSYEAEPDKKFEICTRSLPVGRRERLEPPSDHISVAVARTNTPPPSISWYTAQLPAGSTVYLRAHFMFAPSPNPVDALRATRYGGCVVVAHRERCVFHACQTLPVMSGAPIFLRPEDGSAPSTLEVVGIHLGPASMGTSRYCQIDGNDLDLSNFGYRP
jgi:V8-like Glu-specific endopeptidase